MNEWWQNNCGGEFNSNRGTSGVSTTVAHTGRYAARLYQPNTARMSDVGVRLFRWCESQQQTALYYSAWYYIPQRVTVNGWWHIMQWKSNGSHNAKFVVAVGNRPDGQMYLSLGRGQDSGGGVWSQNIKNVPVGQWFHVEAYYKKAADNTGQVTLWQDGVQLVNVPGVQTANSSDLGWAVISYGTGLNPSNNTMYVDDAVISTTRRGP